MGQRVTTRNNLPAVNERWKKAVAGLHQRLDTLGNTVAQACAGNQAAVAAANTLKTASIDPVKTLFRADAFTASLKCIAGTNEAASLDAREDALREIRRVLRPGAPVFFRQVFPGRAGQVGLVRWFPETERTIDTFPSVEQVCEAFAAAGFRRDAL